MGYDSDAEIKSMIRKIELRTRISASPIRLKIFPPDSRADQDPWINGGLCFGHIDMLYGACDAVWYRESNRPWYDPMNKRYSAINEIPILAIEGTLALERKSSGSAQYQRFSHALGAVLSGVIGVYYLRKSRTVSKMRYDLPKAALNVSQIHDVPCLITNEIQNVEDLVRSIKRDDAREQDRVIARVKQEMKHYYQMNCPSKYLDIERYCDGRSTAKMNDNNYFKILSTNMANLTTAQKRGGHILLGEYLIAKYMLNATRFDKQIWCFLPRLTRQDTVDLNASNKKEWKILWHDCEGRVVTLEDFEGVNSSLSSAIARIRDRPLDRSSGYYDEWREIVQKLMQQIHDGVIRPKTDKKGAPLEVFKYFK